MEWTQERSDLALRLWREGKTASTIAALLGGVSRSAVIGRMHRTMSKGDRRRESPLSAVPARREKDKPRKRGPKPAAPKYNTAGKPKIINSRPAKPSELEHSKREWELLKAQMAARPDVGRVANVLDLEPHHCRWPVGDGPFAFCGDRKIPGKSYCAGHLARSVAGDGSAAVRYAEAVARSLPYTPSKVLDLQTSAEKDIEELHESVAA